MEARERNEYFKEFLTQKLNELLEEDLRIIDISTPSSPSEIHSGVHIGVGSEIEVSGNHLYLGDGGRLSVFDASDPYSPAEVGYYYDEYEVRTIEVIGNRIFMGGSLYILENTLAPAVSLTSPSAWATVSGSVPLDADASHSSGIDRVEFYVDDVLVGTDSSAPYGIIWNAYPLSIVFHDIL